MSEQSPQRKAKRTAERQISKDDDPEGDGDLDESHEAGTFRRASADVLKTRRIVKAKPRLASSPAATPGVPTPAGEASASPIAAPVNPFKAVVLPPSSNATKPPADTAKPATASDNAASDGAAEGAANGSGDIGGSGTNSSGSVEHETNNDVEPKAAAAAAAADLPAANTGAESNAATNARTAPCESVTESPADNSKQDLPADAVSAPESAAASSGTGEEQRSTVDVLPKENTPAPPASQNGIRGGDTGASEGSKLNGAAAESKPATGVAGAGVVSFAALGAGQDGGGGFQSVLTGLKGSNAPLTFGGFGSATPENKISSPSPAASSPADDRKAPVLSFGPSTGFASFTSFASAPMGSTWGKLPSAAGDADKKEAGEDGGVSSTVAEVGSTAGPQLELMDPSEVVNGEEQEVCEHRARAKLFRLADKEWAEMGVGTLKVLRPAADARAGSEENSGEGEAGAAAEDSKATKKRTARLVMRREMGQQVILNVALQQQTKCSVQAEKALLLTCFTAEGPGTFLVKVKTADEASSLKAAVESLLPPAAA